MAVTASPLADTPDGGLQSASPDDFYARFTARNRGLVEEEEQQRLRHTTMLVAGCGSIGGAVAEPFVPLGAEQLLQAEPDDYELHNLNRLQARLADVGRNKAEVLPVGGAQRPPSCAARYSPPPR